MVHCLRQIELATFDSFNYMIHPRGEFSCRVQLSTVLIQGLGTFGVAELGIRVPGLVFSVYM